MDDGNYINNHNNIKNIHNNNCEDRNLCKTTTTAKTSTKMMPNAPNIDDNNLSDKNRSDYTKTAFTWRNNRAGHPCCYFACLRTLNVAISTLTTVSKARTPFIYKMASQSWMTSSSVDQQFPPIIGPHKNISWSFGVTPVLPNVKLLYDAGCCSEVAQTYPGDTNKNYDLVLRDDTISLISYHRTCVFAKNSTKQDQTPAIPHDPLSTFTCWVDDPPFIFPYRLFLCSRKTHTVCVEADSSTNGHRAC